MQDDMPLDNFGAVTEVAAPPAAETEVQTPVEQTAPAEQANGSEATEVQTQPAEDNSIASSEQSDGRPEKRDRLQARFGELTGNLRQKDATIEQLEAQLARFQAMNGVSPLTPDENGYIDPQKLDERTVQVAENLANSKVAQLEQRLERQNIASRLDSEGKEIESRYADLLAANPIHAENIKALVEERVNDNLYNLNNLKNVSATKIAERYFKGIEAAGRQASSRTAQNLTQTAAQAAVTPESAPQVVDPNSDDALAARVADIKF